MEMVVVCFVVMVVMVMVLVVVVLIMSGTYLCVIIYLRPTSSVYLTLTFVSLV